jgi:hypothetical protein
VLIYNPVITVGISYKLQHFDVVLAIFNDKTTTAETTMQMLRRVRDISSKEIYLHFHCCQENTGSHRFPVTDDEVDNFLTERITNTHKDFKQDWISGAISPKGIPELVKDDYYHFAVYSMKHKYKSRNNYEMLMLHYLKTLGMSIVPFDKEMTTKHGLSEEVVKRDDTAYSKSKKQSDIEKWQSIRDAPECNDEEEEALNEKQASNSPLTDSEKKALKKKKLRTHYKYYEYEMSLDWIEIYEPRNMKNIFYNCNILLKYKANIDATLIELQRFE